MNLYSFPWNTLKILYFTLEMSPSAKRDEFYCHLLYRLDGIRISPTDLRSTDQERPVDEKILELLESERYKPYIEKFDEMVEFIDEDKNPTGKFGFLLNFAYLCSLI